MKALILLSLIFASLNAEAFDYESQISEIVRKKVVAADTQTQVEVTKFVDAAKQNLEIERAKISRGYIPKQVRRYFVCAAGSMTPVLFGVGVGLCAETTLKAIPSLAIFGRAGADHGFGSHVQIYLLRYEGPVISLRSGSWRTERSVGIGLYPGFSLRDLVNEKTGGRISIKGLGLAGEVSVTLPEQAEALKAQFGVIPDTKILEITGTEALRKRYHSAEL